MQAPVPPDGARRGPPVVLSTASVYPEGVAAAFTLAAELGYDGVELMVWNDPVSQDVAAVDRIAQRHGVPVVAVHSPCLVVTQRVWSPDPLERLRRSVQAAAVLGADTVVVHPPFRWQRGYAAEFTAAVARPDADDGVTVAVENMFPVRRGRFSVVPYHGGADPTAVGYPHYVLDLSHTAIAGVDALAMADRMGGRLAHLHLTDGSGSGHDEHLVPGRGSQPCAAVCARLAAAGFRGAVSVEISTRSCRSRDQRTALLAESLAFARRHLTPAPGGPRPLPSRP